MAHLNRSLFALSVLLPLATNAASEAAETHGLYQQHAGTACPVGADCVLDFAPVPENFRFEIGNVACYVRGNKYTELDLLQLSVTDGDAPPAAVVTLVPQGIGSTQQANTHAENEKVFVFAAATQHFQVHARSLAGQLFRLACNISGEQVKLS